MELGVSYFGNRILRYVEQDMKSLAQIGCTFVVHTFSENDFYFYRDTMKDIVKVSQAAGLQVYIDPWGVGKVFGGEAFSYYITQRPDIWQVLSDGKPIGMACPNHPDFRAFMKDWIDAAVATGAQVLFWDEPHFYQADWMGARPNTWGCRCQACQKKFKEGYQERLPDKITEQFIDFREDSIRDFLEEMCIYTHTLGRKNAICLLPSEEPIKGIRDWQKIASISGLNILGTDPYWYSGDKKPEEFVGYYSRKVKSLCKGSKLQGQIWVQAFKVPKDREGEIVLAIDTAVNEGIENISVWGFEACAHISCIRSEDPKKTWQAVKDAFAKYKDS